MSKVILQGYIEVPDTELDSVEAELPRHIDLTRNEPGCLTFCVEQDQCYQNRFSVYEVFANQEAFAHHQQRVKASRWGAVTKNVQRHYSIHRC